MDDKDVIDRINGLAHEEHELFDKESRGEASARERARLHDRDPADGGALAGHAGGL